MIQNGDMPAMPVECDLSRTTPEIFGRQVDSHSGWVTGLTKRELFAAMAMQGIVSNDENWLPDYAARRAIAFADALLAELAKKGGGE